MQNEKQIIEISVRNLLQLAACVMSLNPAEKLTIKFEEKNIGLFIPHAELPHGEVVMRNYVRVK